jgi:type III pantothenate kinase
MNLVFDLGNTTQKMAVMSSGEMLDVMVKTKIETNDITLFLKKYYPKRAILSSVVGVGDTAEIKDFLKYKIPLLHLSSKTPVPLQNGYKTLHTLGTDRLACAVAAATLFPKTSVLILQMGTCITSDFISKLGVYKGGSISPGLEMRLQALHHFSAKLPLVAYKNIEILTGTTTEESILTGVIHAIIDECNGISERYRRTYPFLKIILTGGDANLFENKIKSGIFAIDHLVMVGLDVILDYNVEK